MSQKIATIHSAFVIFSLLFSGCALDVRPAPFQETPRSVRSGSLLGPFQGTVRDAATGNPVKDARVTFVWNVRGHDHRLVRHVRTDINGRYYLPTLRFSPGAAGRALFSPEKEMVDDVQMTVEHPEYLPHASSLVPFLSPPQPSAEIPLPPKAGTEFYQLENIVRLTKLSAVSLPHHQAVLWQLAAGGDAGGDEAYYRAAAQLNAEYSWRLDASGLLAEQDLLEVMERDELPRIRETKAAPDSFSRTFSFELDETVVTLSVLHAPVSLLPQWVEARTVQAIRLEIGDDLDARAWKLVGVGGAYGSDGRRISHVVALLPRAGLLFSLSCTAREDAAPSLLKLARRMIARKRLVRFVQAQTGVSMEVVQVPWGTRPLAADRAYSLQVFSDARLHRRVQSIFSLPLGIYEPLDVRYAQKLGAMLQDIPATLVLPPDSRNRIRILALLADGAMHRMVELRSGKAPGAVRLEDVLRLLRAAAMESRADVRQHLAAQTFFELGRYAVPEAPAPGMRTRLERFLNALETGIETAPGREEAGWIVYERPDAVRRLVTRPEELQGVSDGRLLLLFSSGKVQVFSWPPPPRMRTEYPRILQPFMK